MAGSENNPEGLNRRDFLATGSAAGMGLLAGNPLLGQPRPWLTNLGQGQIPRKWFGPHDDQLSIIGLGGYSLATASSYEEAERIVHEAIDAGVNFFDNAWEYHEGRAEEWMGRALAGGRRNRVFLMTKVCSHGRDKLVARQQLEESLRRLRTDHLDLWQIHEVIYDNDPERHFQGGGAVEALTEAKNQGRTRYVGFTGHKSPAIHLRMLSYHYAFDAVQMPLNCFDANYRSFERHVLPEVVRLGMAALGMKSLGGGGEPIVQGAIRVEDALRYAMSLPVATTISGIDSMDVLRQNLDVARNFRPLTPQQMEDLRRRCREQAGDGHLEMYKSTVKYDGALGREQHRFPSPEELPL